MVCPDHSWPRIALKGSGFETALHTKATGDLSGFPWALRDYSGPKGWDTLRHPKRKKKPNSMPCFNLTVNGPFNRVIF